MKVFEPVKSVQQILHAALSAKHNLALRVFNPDRGGFSECELSSVNGKVYVTYHGETVEYDSKRVKRTAENDDLVNGRIWIESDGLKH